MYAPYINSLSYFLEFLSVMFPCESSDAMTMLELALQEPASPTEPKIVLFLMYMYHKNDVKDPDDFQVKECNRIVLDNFNLRYSIWPCICSEFYAVFVCLLLSENSWIVTPRATSWSILADPALSLLCISLTKQQKN